MAARPSEIEFYLFKNGGELIDPATRKPISFTRTRKLKWDNFILQLSNELKKNKLEGSTWIPATVDGVELNRDNWDTLAPQQSRINIYLGTTGIPSRIITPATTSLGPQLRSTASLGPQLRSTTSLGAQTFFPRVPPIVAPPPPTIVTTVPGTLTNIPAFPGTTIIPPSYSTFVPYTSTSKIMGFRRPRDYKNITYTSSIPKPSKKIDLSIFTIPPPPIPVPVPIPEIPIERKIATEQALAGILGTTPSFAQILAESKRAPLVTPVPATSFPATTPVPAPSVLLSESGATIPQATAEDYIREQGSLINSLPEGFSNTPIEYKWEFKLLPLDAVQLRKINPPERARWNITPTILYQLIKNREWFENYINFAERFINDMRRIKKTTNKSNSLARLLHLINSLSNVVEVFEANSDLLANSSYLALLCGLLTVLGEYIYPYEIYEELSKIADYNITQQLVKLVQHTDLQIGPWTDNFYNKRCKSFRHSSVLVE